MSRNVRSANLTLTLALFGLLALLLVGCGGDDSFSEVPPGDDTNGITPPPTDTFTGSGSDVIPFTIGTSGAVTFKLIHTGDGAFVVWLLDSSAERVALLTAKVGDVSDTRVENLSAGSYFLDIESTGEWSVSVTGSTGSAPGTPPGTDPATLPFVTFAASTSPPSELTIPLGDFRNAALILDPERGPAPAGGLNVNYVLVDDPRLIQDIGLEDKLDGEPVEGRASIDGVVEVNNADPIKIAGGDFAVTFQVQALNSGTALLILVGGDGYVPPTWPDVRGQLVINVPEEDEDEEPED